VARRRSRTSRDKYFKTYELLLHATYTTYKYNTYNLPLSDPIIAYASRNITDYHHIYSSSLIANEHRK
jgi:hypothetical protein